MLASLDQLSPSRRLRAMGISHGYEDDGIAVSYRDEGQACRWTMVGPKLTTGFDGMARDWSRNAADVRSLVDQEEPGRSSSVSDVGTCTTL